MLKVCSMQNEVKVEESTSRRGFVTADLGAHFSLVSAERDLQPKSVADRDFPVGSLHLIRLRFTALPLFTSLNQLSAGDSG